MAGVTRVKVCGLTRAEDVRLAVELGAWAARLRLRREPAAHRPCQGQGPRSGGRRRPDRRRRHHPDAGVDRRRRQHRRAGSSAAVGRRGRPLSRRRPGGGKPGPAPAARHRRRGHARRRPRGLRAARRPGSRGLRGHRPQARLGAARGRARNAPQGPRPRRRPQACQRRRGDRRAASGRRGRVQRRRDGCPGSRTQSACISSSPPWNTPTRTSRTRPRPRGGRPQ